MSNLKYINIPVRLLKKAKSNKQSWDMLVFAVCLKLNRNDSGMFINDPKVIMNAFHCSHRKPQRLMTQAAANTELFHYNPKSKFITANSFKRGCKIYNTHKGEAYRADSCIRIETEEDGTISHYKLSIRLHDKLIKRMLRKEAPSDEFKSRNIFHSEKRKPLTQKFIGNVAGYHQTTVSRHLRKMEKDGLIKISSHEKVPVWDIEHGIVIKVVPHRKPFISGRFAYVRDVNDYEIIDLSMLSDFRHIIYNHKLRVVNREKKQPTVMHSWDLYYDNAN